MINSKATKHTFRMSVLALIMCVAMLIGTTYAWFTDSVTSGSNVIKAGNLDIVMEYWDGDEWVDAEGKTLEFKKASTSAGTEVLWEPGCTYELPKFRVRNEGNLAAKILIRLNGVTGDEKLMEAIELKTKITNMPESLLTGSASSTFSKFDNASVDLMYGTPDGTIIFDHSLMGEGVVAPNTGHTDTSPEFTISGHMKEEAGNEYQNLKIEGISITVLATQQVYEYDSFGREYDKNAEYDNVVVVDSADDLIAALTDIKTEAKNQIPGENGNKQYREPINIVLQNDLVIDGDTEMMYTDSNGAAFHFYGVKGVIDLNGYNITVAEDALMDGKNYANAVFLFQYSDVDIVGDGSIIAENKSIPVYAWANCTVNIYGGNYVTNAYERNESAVYVNNASAKVNVYGGTYTDSEYAFNVHDNCGNTPVIVLHEGVTYEDFLKNGTTDVTASDINAGRIVLADSCELNEYEENGVAMNKVVLK